MSKNYWKNHVENENTEAWKNRNKKGIAVTSEQWKSFWEDLRRIEKVQHIINQMFWFHGGLYQSKIYVNMLGKWHCSEWMCEEPEVMGQRAMERGEKRRGGVICDWCQDCIRRIKLIGKLVQYNSGALIGVRGRFCTINIVYSNTNWKKFVRFSMNCDQKMKIIMIFHTYQWDFQSSGQTFFWFPPYRRYPTRCRWEDMWGCWRYRWHGFEWDRWTW
jgi:hypothetical protein